MSFMSFKAPSNYPFPVLCHFGPLLWPPQFPAGRMCFSRPTAPWSSISLALPQAHSPRNPPGSPGSSKGRSSCCLSGISTAPNSYKWEENTTKQRQGEIPGLLKADPPLLCFPGKPWIRHVLHTPPAP